MIDGAGLAAENLACERGGRTVFTGVGFMVPPGGALVLRGPNGSGKSSLLRLLAGLLAPAAGSITWNGAPADEDIEALHARLRYVGHLDAVKPALTVAENLAFWARLHGGEGDVAESLESLAIGHLAAVPARLLSAGQRRRLALARIVAAPAPLWLLDEPTVTLDEQSVAIVEALIAAHRGGGGLVVVATHAGLELPGVVVLDLGAAEGVSAGGVSAEGVSAGGVSAGDVSP